MSLMGIDIGTTGCKASVFSEDGTLLAQAYREYDIERPQPGWQEINSKELWDKVRQIISEVAVNAKSDPIKAFAVSSCGEAITPVSRQREILGNTILGMDERGQEYVAQFQTQLDAEAFFELNGNVLGFPYTMPKLQWLRDHEPEIFAQAKLLLNQDFIFYMMGCDPVTDYSLANRTLLFDLKEKNWSDRLLQLAGIPKDKLAHLVPAGTVVGTISDQIADELGLPRGVKAVTGGHDQCCNALGVGITKPGTALYGLGTFACITPVYQGMPDSASMLANGLNVEDHVIPGLYVSFLWNGSGGSVVKWFRDTLAKLDKEQAIAQGLDVYEQLMNEMPNHPTNLLVLPHFTPTGPPLFATNTSGVIAGLKLETTRGEILKALIEGITYYFKDGMGCLERAGITTNEYRPSGGGAKSPVWLQTISDIMGKPLIKTKATEAGSMGATMLAGLGCGVYNTVDEAVEQFVEIERVYEPNKEVHKLYQGKFELYQQLYPALQNLLTGLS